jgi:hypothetical protein
MLPLPGLLPLLAPAVLDETAIGISMKGLQRLVDGLMGEEHGLPPRAVVAMVPLMDHDGIEEMPLEALAVAVAGMLLRPVLVGRRQPHDADHLRLQTFGPRLFALAMRSRAHTAADRPLPGGQRPHIRGHGHLFLGWYDKAETLLVQPPPSGPVQKAPVKEHPLQARLAAQIGAGLRNQLPSERASCSCIFTT